MAARSSRTATGSRGCRPRGGVRVGGLAQNNARSRSRAGRPSSSPTFRRCIATPVFDSLQLGLQGARSRWTASCGSCALADGARPRDRASLAGVTPTDRTAGAEGLRLAARGMWLRVIVAVGIVVLTLLAMSSARSGGEGTFKMLRFMMMAGACATVVAFAMVGLGIARTARATIANLPRVPLALSAACSMWCCGVEFSKLPFIYRMLYKGDYSGYGGRDTGLPGHIRDDRAARRDRGGCAGRDRDRRSSRPSGRRSRCSRRRRARASASSA